jgi:hypothetical protein
MLDSSTTSITTLASTISRFDFGYLNSTVDVATCQEDSINEA